MQANRIVPRVWRVNAHARGSFQRIKSFKESKELQAAHAREQREEKRIQKQQEKERLRAEALAKQEALRRAKQQEREELIRIEAEHAAIRQKHENEFHSARNKLPDSARQWLAKANAEEFWVRKDFYHLRAYTEAYLVGEVFLSASPAIGA